MGRQSPCFYSIVMWCPSSKMPSPARSKKGEKEQRMLEFLREIDMPQYSNRFNRRWAVAAITENHRMRDRCH
jgi:hypothetical protein